MEVILNEDELCTIGRLEKDAEKKQVKPVWNRTVCRMKKKRPAVEIKKSWGKGNKERATKNKRTEKLCKQFENGHKRDA
jgi:hypothetical protein